MVQVEHRKRFAGEDHLVVVQPDGTLALIPAWMSEETARSTAITSSPCLSVDRLVEYDSLGVDFSRRGLLMDSLIERMLVEALADDGVATHAASDKAREVADEQDRA